MGVTPQVLSTLFLAKIVFDKSNPLGIVTLKNLILLDNINLESPRGIKHANGRDWWIITAEIFTGKNYCFLLKNGILSQVQIFDFEEKLDNWTDGQCEVSPDGTKLSRVCVDGVIIYDFDRCSGIISNPNIVYYPKKQTLGGGAIFSSNSKWLYLTSSEYLWQINMDKYPYQLDSAAKLIVNNDGFPTYMSLGELGPDGKIYIITSSTTQYMHLIEYPDVGCPNCNFKSNAINHTFFNGFFGIPNFPNYRLGPLEGSECDTILYTKNNNNTAFIHKIYPNPAGTSIRIELNSNLTHSNPINLRVYSIVGEIIYAGTMPPYAYIHDIDLMNWPNGMYYYRLGENNNNNISGKFIVMK